MYTGKLAKDINSTVKLFGGPEVMCNSQERWIPAGNTFLLAEKECLTDILKEYDISGITEQEDNDDELVPGSCMGVTFENDVSYVITVNGQEVTELEFHDRDARLVLDLGGNEQDNEYENHNEAQGDAARLQEWLSGTSVAVKRKGE